MIVLRIAVPVLVLLVVLYRAPRNPIYVAGLPLIVAFGYAIFLPIIPSYARRHVTIQDGLILMVFLGWFWTKLARPWPKRMAKNEWFALGVLMFAFLAFEVVLMLIRDGAGGLSNTIYARQWFYIPLGYLLMLDTYRRYSREEVLDFIRFLSVASALLMFLYIPSELGVNIYPFTRHVENLSSGATLIRDFYTFPFWTGLAVAYWSSRSRQSLVSILALVLLGVGAFFSYTRSIVGLLVLTPLAAAALYAIRPRNIGRVVAIVSVVAVGLFGATIVLPRVASSQYSLFVSRTSELAQSGANPTNVATAAGRITEFVQGYRYGASVDSLFGAGLGHSGAASTSGVAPEKVTWDSDWVDIVQSVGVVGLVVLALPLLGGLVAGLIAFFKRRDAVGQQLSLTILLFVFWTIASRFVGIYYQWWFALALWGIALVAIDSKNLWSQPRDGAVAKLPTLQRQPTSLKGGFRRKAPGGVQRESGYSR